MAKEKDLNDAFHETLKDVYFAEKHSVKACKKGAKAASAPELKAVFEDHAIMSQNQVARLEQVFESIDKSPRAKTCEAMSGIMSEMEEDLEDFGGTPAGDAVLIGCAQAVEHYEMARYGMLRTWAEQLGNSAAAKLLAATLAEEEATDKKLSALAEQLNTKGTKVSA